MDVSDLTTLAESFMTKLKKHDESTGCYSTWKLKERLTLLYMVKLVFIARPGKSDLVYSGKIAVGQAKRSSSSKRRKEAILSETQILHTAAGILSRNMTQAKDDTSFYINNYQLILKACGSYVPDKSHGFETGIDYLTFWCAQHQSIFQQQQ